MNPAFRFQGVLWFAKRLLRWHPLTKCEIVRWNLGGVKKQKREPAIKDSFFYLFLLLFLPSFIWGEPEKQGENWTGSDYRATVQRPSVIPLISEEKSTRLESVEGVGSLCVEIPWFPTGFGSHPWWWMQDFDKCRVYYTDWCWGWILYLGYPPVKRWRCIWVNRGDLPFWSFRAFLRNLHLGRAKDITGTYFIPSESAEGRKEGKLHPLRTIITSPKSDGFIFWKSNPFEARSLWLSSHQLWRFSSGHHQQESPKVPKIQWKKSRKFTLPETTWKWMVGIRLFPLGLAYIQGLLLLVSGSVSKLVEGCYLWVTWLRWKYKIPNLYQPKATKSSLNDSWRPIVWTQFLAKSYLYPLLREDVNIIITPKSSRAQRKLQSSSNPL